MSKADMFKFTLLVPITLSIFMWGVLMLDGRLMYSDTIPVPVFLTVWFSGAASSVIGLIVALLLKYRNSEIEFGVFGSVSCIGILANALGFLYLLAAIPRL